MSLKEQHDWSNKDHGMCYPVCGMLIKYPLLLFEKDCVCSFLSHYLNGPLPYVRRHITVLKCVEFVVKYNTSFLKRTALQDSDNYVLSIIMLNQFCCTHLMSLFLFSSQCSTTGLTKAVVCAILSVGWCI